MGGGNTKQKSQDATGLNLRNDEAQMLKRCLYSLPFPPGTINAGIVSAAAKNTERVEYHEPVKILTKGDRAMGIYILVKGHAKVLLSSEDTVANLYAGSFFGEISTLFYVPVTATVQTTGQAQFLLLKEELLRKAIGEVVSTDLMDYYVKQRYFDTSGKLDQGELMHRIAVDNVRKIPLFSQWQSPALDALVKQCKEDCGIPYPVMLIPDRTMLLMEEDKSEEVVVVTRGQVEIRREKELIAAIPAGKWPVWVGEEGLFSNIDNLCAVQASGVCQAFRLKKATVQKITNMFKEQEGEDFEKRSKDWQMRLSYHDSLPDRFKVELHFPVILSSLRGLPMFRPATMGYLYDLAMHSRAKAYADMDVIVDGNGKPAKIRKALQASQARQQKAFQPPPTPLGENDVFLLPLKGQIAVAGVENFLFKEKSILFLPEAQLKEIQLVARGETLVMTIEGSIIYSMANSGIHQDVVLNFPPPVL